MVTPWCTTCKCRRDSAEVGDKECADKAGHKKALRWKAGWQFSRRSEDRYRKTLRTQEAAEKQVRQWQDQHEDGELGPRKKAPVYFGMIADKYWNEHALIENRKPERSTFFFIRKLKRLIGENTRVSPLSDRELVDFQNVLRQLQRTLRAKATGATVNRYFTVLRSIFERNKMWGVIKVNPCDLIERVQEEEPLPRFLEIAEIEKVRWAVENLAEYAQQQNLPPISHEQIKRLRVRVAVYLHTGARPSSQEECNWDNGDVDLEHRIIWFTTYKGGKQKMHRYPLSIDNELYQILLERAEVTQKKGLVFDCRGVSELEVLAVKASGVNEGKNPKQLFTMYGLKHCFASHHLMAGASESEVAKMLGHTDTRMVHKHYGHLTMGHLRKVQERINLTPPLMRVI